MKRKEKRQTAKNGRWYQLPGSILLILALTVVIANYNSIGEVEAAAGSGDPLVGSTFILEIGGVSGGYFTECTGIGSENELIEHRVALPDGGDGVQKLPGRLKWNNIVLKRKITNNTDMWAWRKQVEDGKIADARKSLSIVMCDQTGKPVAKWSLSNGWISKINTSVAADGNLMEEVIIVCESEERIN